MIRFKILNMVTEQTINSLPYNLKEGTSERVGGSFAVKKGLKQS